jgi:hypothetical protein
MQMTCEDTRDRLSEFADGGLPRDAAAEVAAHLDVCASCRGLRDDLVRLRDAARSLGPIAPPDHLGLEIAGQLRLDGPPAAEAPSRSSGLRQWLGLAAAIAIVTLGAYLLAPWITPGNPVTSTPPAATAGTTPGPDDATARIEAVVQELGSALEKAIVDLQALAKDTNRPAEGELATQLLANLTVIDSAIAESRTALALDPGDVTARDSLLEALRRKVGVLQTTMTLINDLRVGDAAGASQALTGKKS